MESHKPLGLGNSDNSCYQNSILQGLASLLSLREYLSIFDKRGLIMEDLYLLLSALNSPERPTWKPFIWTPARLKNMDSVTQQDAQEYFSKLVDEICKEAAERLKSNPKPGLEGLNACTKDASDEEQKQPTNPLEGLIAQRVVCTTCGFSEGLSLTPFNCLTVPLEREEKCSVGQCLDDYTKAEDINGVECVRCTLLAAEKQLTLMLGRCDPSQKGQKEFYDDLSSRLSAVKYSLRNDVYSDKNLRENCKISKSNYRCSTKTRQAVIARAPKALAIHINRSVFNEATFELVKNHATVDFDMGLNLSKWMLEIKSLLGGMNEQVKYNLRAVVAHYGRHDDGHYVCFRQHAVHDDGNGDNNRQEPMKSQWWVFSDEDVRPYPEEGVLAQKGAFMLFYE
ncbi:cysteine proteinase, partial [Piedraia hortae CBS 480.64]